MVGGDEPKIQNVAVDANTQNRTFQRSRSAETPQRKAALAR